MRALLSILLLLHTPDHFPYVIIPAVWAQRMNGVFNPAYSDVFASARAIVGTDTVVVTSANAVTNFADSFHVLERAGWEIDTVLLSSNDFIIED